MRNQSEICPSLALFILMLLLGAAANGNGASSADASCFSPKRLEQWIQQKCGNDGSAVWVYEGALYDPLDGHKIANVEGLELVRRLADSSDESAWAKRAKQLKAFNMTREADYSATLLTRRLFCYQSPQQPRRLLDSIRLRPNAPLRKIPVHQAVAVYDSATTYVCRDDKLYCTPNGPMASVHGVSRFHFQIIKTTNNMRTIPLISTSFPNQMMICETTCQISHEILLVQQM